MQSDIPHLTHYLMIQLHFIDAAGKDPITLDNFSVYYCGVNVFSRCRIDKGCYGVMDRNGSYPPRIKQNDIGLLSHLKSTYRFFHSKCLRASFCCHSDNLFCTHSGCIAADSFVDQDPSHQGDCLLHAAVVSFSHLLVEPLAADAAGFFIGQFDRFSKQNWNRRTQRYRHTLVRV